MICPTCGSANSAGRRFCGECGHALTVTCPVCGAANDPVRFCGQCGSPLETPETAGGRAAPTSERRLVSVLFADLVGFTTLSESRDPDEVRDLLGRYFESSRTLVERYGGTVEKFIGDAVMAVWGTPVAQEDDAERAVRAALDLVQAVPALGAEAGLPELRARAGVLTGEASVSLGAQGQGMVAGDLVNTASRIQAAAEPGMVLVGERTRRASEAAVAYADAGSHELKGKAEPVPLWRAMRVVALRGGAQRSQGLEGPFVGRDPELRTVKELFHASAGERRSHLLSVIGVAGIGKSRLSWEFSKYIDGLQETIRWHRGRCLAYGDGVTYWALAEMVRSRAGIVEGEDPASARAKLRACAEEWLTDSEERAGVELRLAHLLALEDRTAREPEDLFSAWRVFFERIAEREPVILVFEDMQWADPSLLDFVEYLLNWSRSHRVFVMALARPEILDRFPGWAASRRGVSTMYLEPLGAEAMQALLDGMVPGLPPPVRDRILERAEGVPLYAVETVRMLLDRGLLVEEGSAYRLSGPIEDLAVPETLHALIASRLDGLPPEERALLQDAAVVGKTFSVPALAAVTGKAEPELASALASLVRKELLFVQADPRSPERGQYGFLQDLVRKVANDTLSLRERKARHLAIAEHLQRNWTGEEQERSEILAAHYLDAYRAAPQDPDGPDIKGLARETLVQAATRSESLAARREALGYLEQAIELADDPAVRAALLERAGNASFAAGLLPHARELFDNAIAICRDLGDDVAGARIEVQRAGIALADGRLEEALERSAPALEVLAAGEPTAALAEAAAEVGRLRYFLGQTDEAFAPIELALTVAEQLFLPETLSQAMNTKGLILSSQGRRQEAMVLLRGALTIAKEHDASMAAMRAMNNLASLMADRGRMDEEASLAEEGLALARRVGYRGWEMKFRAARVSMMVFEGRWDEAVAEALEISGDPDLGTISAVAGELGVVCIVHAARGEFERAAEAMLAPTMESDNDVQAVAGLGVMRATVASLAGRLQDAIDQADRAIAVRGQVGFTGAVIESYLIAANASLDLGDTQRAMRYVRELESIPRSEGSLRLDAGLANLRARLAAAAGDNETAQAQYHEAIAAWRALGVPFDLAMGLLGHGVWLAGQGRTADASLVLGEARQIFERLGATLPLRRVRAALGEPDEAEHQPTPEAARA